MLLLNKTGELSQPLDERDAAALSATGAFTARMLLSQGWHELAATPMYTLNCLANLLGVASISVKDEGERLGLGSFKALGGSHAVFHAVLEEAGRCMQRRLELKELLDPEVRRIAHAMTFACATDGNHGKSVAAAARIVGAASVVFVHSGVTADRIDEISQQGARIVRIAGTYDDSVEAATQACLREGWLPLSDTSWEGYEEVPLQVMQGYTVMVQEAVESLAHPPTHVFIQAGVGGLAASVASYLHSEYGHERPLMVIVEPEAAACIFESAHEGRPAIVANDTSTAMSMLECYKASPLAWRILARRADAFLTITDQEALQAVRQLENPVGSDIPIRSTPSGAAGLAGLFGSMSDRTMREQLDLGPKSRVLVINTEQFAARCV